MNKITHLNFCYLQTENTDLTFFNSRKGSANLLFFSSFAFINCFIRNSHCFNHLNLNLLFYYGKDQISF